MVRTGVLRYRSAFSLNFQIPVQDERSHLLRVSLERQGSALAEPGQQSSLQCTISCAAAPANICC